jgi:hypothetical protein
MTGSPTPILNHCPDSTAHQWMSAQYGLAPAPTPILPRQAALLQWFTFVAYTLHHAAKALTGPGWLAETMPCAANDDVTMPSRRFPSFQPSPKDAVTLDRAALLRSGLALLHIQPAMGRLAQAKDLGGAAYTIPVV